MTAVPRRSASAPEGRMHIGGGWCGAASGATTTTYDPSTGAPLAEVAEGDATDVDRAVSAARAAFEGEFSRTTPADRERLLFRLAELVERHHDELRRLDARDMGMPLGPGEGPVDGAGVADVLRYFGGWATKVGGQTLPNSRPGQVLSLTLREPVGVVGAIIPWNGPIGAVLWKLAAPLAVGCTVVLKPAEEAALSTLRIAELATEAGYPAGTVNVVTGRGEVVGAALAAHRGVDKISFTGSTETGRRIVEASAGNLKRLTLEMGGKAPDIVFADADLDRAVPGAAIGVFANTGQICCAGSRIFVERPVYEEVAGRIAEFAAALQVGHSLDRSTTIGPIVSAAQLDRVLGYVEVGRREGARMLSGGARLTEPGLADGYFVPPTVFADVTDEMTIAREEIFGPVACVLPFDSEDEVVRRANATDYGLGGGVWTRDGGRAVRVARVLRTGTVWVNSYLHFDPAVPFGGHKTSGWGSDLGPQALEGHLTTKSVWWDATP